MSSKSCQKAGDHKYSESALFLLMDILYMVTLYCFIFKHFLILRFWLHVFDLPGDQLEEACTMIIGKKYKQKNASLSFYS